VPPEAAQYYIISVRGLPGMQHSPDQWRHGPESPDDRRQREGQLQKSTELQRRGMDPIHPERVETSEKDGQRAAVFLFPRARPISLDDKEVVFVSGAGPIRLKVKFALKDMVYRGNLDL
jgi:hypothetical protein